ncbi:MAG TPA: glycosyl hydrolase family 39 [Terriglobia bacterium]|nr:glycosyl hydrolase family 39 [Terriglobia bacterium]
MEIPAGTPCGNGGELVNRNPAAQSRRWELRGIAGLAMAGLACLSGSVGCSNNAEPGSGLIIHWDRTTVVSNTTATLQVVVNPPLRPGQPLGIASYQAVNELGADYVRYVPWLPYPKLAVAELQPPTSQGTSWDFSLIDPMMADFMNATAGHSVVVNFSTIPQWMFVTDAPVSYPADPDQETWDYEQGTELRDRTCQELGDYYNRLVSWYVDGGFTDENGVQHESGYHYQFPIWEVLNEVEFEHNTTPEDYVKRYDAIVAGIRSASPDTKFMGMALGAPGNDLDFIQYFLDPSNHQPGIPLDYISYHFYAGPPAQQTIADWPSTFFQQADGFLSTVRSIEAIRKQLAPQTKTDIDELGTILPTDNTPADSVPPPPAYWNLSGALYAYLYLQLARLQIDVVGESQLVGFPSQFPSVSMMDWTTNQPNARFWVLKLIKDSFHPGDTMVETDLGVPNADLEAQAFITPAGHKLLLVNKTGLATDVPLPDADTASALTVDSQSAEGPARSVSPAGGKITLQPFAVTVVSW